MRITRLVIGQPFVCLKDGRSLSMWRPRCALKMWTGWPTSPMIFVKGVLVGGVIELQALISSGDFRGMLRHADCAPALN